ncbi:MAG TPA: hypothetical protein VFM98_24010 [Ramlibacter sp.]|uniref:hypothetical protein n=1 Tax=Ramlibacter sp. TaxID=1917967 RepID=UPI002D7E6306|nr:hypothetical protein [Ramlibacter sp.]HET8748681.1 hypothetical protein [Ramlibacter sp.]
MRFDVSIAHEAGWTRVGVIGEPTLGRLLSLLQVLEVDSAAWSHPALLLDLRGLRTPLAREEQQRLAAEAHRVLWHLKVAVLGASTEPPPRDELRFFADAEAAREWLKGP